MKKLILSTILILSLINVKGQIPKKTLLVYTLDSNALFIPYINGKQMLMMPTDSFYYEFDTIQKFELAIHFDNDTISDIQTSVNFNNLKSKKYRIKRVSAAKEKAILKTPKYKKSHLYPLYKIKKESMNEYLETYEP